MMRYMAEYDVRRSLLSQASGYPDVIGQPVLKLADWYFT